MSSDQPSSEGHRLTAVSEDNHQAWLWVAHFFTVAWIVITLFMRAKIKWRQPAKSDAVLVVGHIFYLAYWLLTLFALLNGLGKASNLLSSSEMIKASKLIFASRILLFVTLTVAQWSTIFLIQEIFTKDATKWWFRIVVVATFFEALIGCLIISVSCSPSHVVFPTSGSQCSGTKARWIVVSVMEGVIELILFVPVARIVATLQTSFKNKLWAVVVFMIRLVIWIPTFVHISEYVKFMDHGRASIDLVPTIILEEFWACIALVAASVPALMRIAKKFTTSGLHLGNTGAQTSLRSRTKESKNSQTTSVRMRTVPNAASNMVLRPDGGVNTINIDAANKGEGASIGSNAESHIGILRHVDFEVSSDQKGNT